jgi:hypothetical protein
MCNVLYLKYNVADGSTKSVLDMNYHLIIYKSMKFNDAFYSLLQVTPNKLQ